MKSVFSFWSLPGQSSTNGAGRHVGRWRPVVFLLGWLTFCSATLAVGSTGSLASIESASIKLRQLAESAAGGDIYSSYDMNKIASQIDQKIKAFESRQGNDRPPWTPPEKWGSVHKEIEYVVGNADEIERYHDLAFAVKSQLPIMQTWLDGLAVDTNERKRSAGRALSLLDAADLLASMSVEITEYIGQGENAERAAASLSQGMASFEKTISALRDGNRDLGIKAESNSILRAQLDKVQATMIPTFSDLKALIDGTQTMKKFIESTSRIADVSAEMAASARKAGIEFGE